MILKNHIAYDTIGISVPEIVNIAGYHCNSEIPHHAYVHKYITNIL